MRRVASRTSRPYRKRRNVRHCSREDPRLLKRSRRSRMHNKAGQYPSHKARQQFDSDGAVWTPMPGYPVTTHAHFMWLAAR